jgi:hypothetical protein
METKYTNTANPNAIYRKDDVDSPTNLHIKRENIVAANFNNKLKQEVPNSHKTPENSDVEDNNVE